MRILPSRRRARVHARQHPLRLVPLLAAAATGLLSPARAADFDFLYGAGISWYYSQDVFRTGADATDDYLTTARLSAEMLARTPRSLTSVRYAPEYAWYEEFDTLDRLDHRLGTTWRLNLGPLSTFELRQGLSDTSRQVGFQDLAGVGGNVSEPVTARSRRIAWDVEPRLKLVRSPGTTATFEAIYREESYDLSTLIDSRQIGLQAALEKNFGAAQYLGGRIRADAYSFDLPESTVVGSYDRFINAQLSWARRIGEAMSLQAAGGAYRSSGPGLDAVVRPTFDLSGFWRWQRTYLSVAYELSYASGGGISTANRSQWGHVALATTWGEGFEGGTDLGYIYRASPSALLGEDRPLGGWSVGVHLSKSWLTGVGIIARVSQLQQDRRVGPDLDFREASFGVTYAPPRKESSPVSPEGYSPGDRRRRRPDGGYYKDSLAPRE